MSSYNLIIFRTMQAVADVAKLADAQPSEGCGRKVVEVRLLSSAPALKSYFGIIALLFLVGLPIFSGYARLAERINPRKMADDINGKTVDFGTVNLQGIPLTKKSFKKSLYSNQRYPHKRVVTDRLDRNKLHFPLQDNSVLPRQNFRAKRMFDKNPSLQQKSVAHRKAKIRDRHIHATTPAGNEELKKQLNTPH